MDTFALLISLAGQHVSDAATGEVFLKLEGIEPTVATECWKESFRHPEREAAVAVEHACASRWADWDLRGMALAVLGERRSDAQVVKMAASLLCRLPHEEAWPILSSMPGETETVRLHYLTALASTDPARALALLPPLTRGYPGGGGREAVIRAASTAAPELASGWLKESKAGGSDARAVASVLALSDPPAALSIARWLAAEGHDLEADSTAASVFNAWSASEPGTAGCELITWLGGNESRTPVTSWYTGHAFEPVTGCVFRAWAAACPEEALAGARSIPQEHMRRIALNSVGLGWPEAEKAMSAARELPLVERLAFLELLSKYLAQASPELLRRELDGLPPPQSITEAFILRDCWEQLSEEDAREFERKAPDFFEEHSATVGSIAGGVFASRFSPEVLKKSLEQVRSVIGQSKA